MKGARVLTAVWVLSGSTALAQTPTQDVVRPDIAGSIGWLNVNKSGLDSYNDWYNRGLQGAVTFGWYRSPHLKTELEASASTRVDFYSSREVFVGSFPAHVFSEYAFATRRVTLGQQYQFGENAWFHPHLAAGLDFNWETTRRHDREFLLYDPATRQNRPIQRAVDHPDRTDLHVRPFAAVGFKAYVTPRAFVRSDMRVVVYRRIEEVLIRFGVGVDF